MSNYNAIVKMFNKNKVIIIDNVRYNIYRTVNGYEFQHWTDDFSVTYLKQSNFNVKEVITCDEHGKNKTVKYMFYKDLHVYDINFEPITIDNNLNGATVRINELFIDGYLFVVNGILYRLTTDKDTFKLRPVHFSHKAIKVDEFKFGENRSTIFVLHDNKEDQVYFVNEDDVITLHDEIE